MQRATRQRAAILELLEESTQFLGAQQIQQLLAGQGHPVSLAPVHRALQALTDAQELDVRHAHEGWHLYRRCTRTEPHHHLLCRNCGTGLPRAVIGQAGTCSLAGRGRGGGAGVGWH